MGHSPSHRSNTCTYSFCGSWLWLAGPRMTTEGIWKDQPVKPSHTQPNWGTGVTPSSESRCPCSAQAKAVAFALRHLWDGVPMGGRPCTRTSQGSADFQSHVQLLSSTSKSPASPHSQASGHASRACSYGLPLVPSGLYREDVSFCLP